MASQQQFPPQQQGSQPGKEHAMDPRPEAIIKSYKATGKLKDKVALVTGGDSGIGRAVCLCFTLEGATVAFTYVKGHEEKDAEETLHALRDIKSRTGARGDPMAVPTDLGYEENCRRVVEEVAGAYGGRIDVLVNNTAEQYGLPDGAEFTDSIPQEKHSLLFQAFDGLAAPFAEFLAATCADERRRPDWIIVDIFHHWVAAFALEHKVPSIPIPVPNRYLIPSRF
jgi:NAD(P)-dependent dehydrogenase (short-subunit alcohol dehydrogenase family)